MSFSIHNEMRALDTHCASGGIVANFSGTVDAEPKYHGPHDVISMYVYTHGYTHLTLSRHRLDFQVQTINKLSQAQAVCNRPCLLFVLQRYFHIYARKADMQQNTVLHKAALQLQSHCPHVLQTLDNCSNDSYDTVSGDLLNIANLLLLGRSMSLQGDCCLGSSSAGWLLTAPFLPLRCP